MGLENNVCRLGALFAVPYGNPDYIHSSLDLDGVGLTSFS